MYKPWQHHRQQQHNNCFVRTAMPASITTTTTTTTAATTTSIQIQTCERKVKMGPQIKFFLNKFQLLPCSVHSVCRSLKSNTNAQTILCTWMALQNANAPSIFQSKHIVIIHNCTTQPTHHITSLSLFLIHIRTESFSNARKPLSLSLSKHLFAARSYKIPGVRWTSRFPWWATSHTTTTTTS